MAWELTKKLGVESDSLSSFYGRKYPSVEHYIRSLATYYHMEIILQVLNINDGELTGMVQEATRLKKAETARTINEWYKNH